MHEHKHEHDLTSLGAMECCPRLEPCQVCDELDVRYRVPFRRMVKLGDRQQLVTVLVTLHFRFRRCAGPLSLGDLLYTTTLLPGEQVRLFTSDRHSRFTFDSSSQLAYRHHNSSEESVYTAGMAHAVSDLDIVENENKVSSYSESSVSGGGGAGIDLGIVEIGGSVSAGSFDSNSVSKLARSLSSHAESSSRHVEVGVRAASSTSIGEVNRREHAEGQSEDHFESSSRVFANPNKCRAITFLFYRIDKCQDVSFELVSVERNVQDVAAPTIVALNPKLQSGGVFTVPNGVIATQADRLEVERRAQASATAKTLGTIETPPFTHASIALAQGIAAEPLAAALRKAALEEVDKELMAEGLIGKDGSVSPETSARFGWKRKIALPTPGIVVRGCLDQCDVCEPELHKAIELDLVKKELENELLKRQIELLDKAQEYRCCPGSSTPEA
jgi:hypothetical protein